MGKYNHLKFNVGDRLVFKGSVDSYYGRNPRFDNFIGKFVTISDTYFGGSHPNAYLIMESDERFWLSEDCFEDILPDLPEFEASCELNKLLF